MKRFNQPSKLEGLLGTAKEDEQVACIQALAQPPLVITVVTQHGQTRAQWMPIPGLTYADVRNALLRAIEEVQKTETAQVAAQQAQAKANNPKEQIKLK